MDKRYLRFEKLGIVCVVAVYLLILAGGIVRSTGSGMGCPDWPRCFGRIIPPTNESELPPDYQERYKNHGYGKAKFNPVKTWIEYINRLLGALIGLFAISLFAFSFIYKGKDNAIIKLSGIVLLLVIIEGIIGKYVVSTNLKPVMVSVHMWGSIIIIVLLIYIVSRIHQQKLSAFEIERTSELKILNYLVIVFSVLQVALGTQVRQDIDIISANLDYTLRETWIEQLGNVFYIHRSFSIMIVLIHVYFIYRLRKFASHNVTLLRAGYWLLVLIGAEVIMGIVLGYWDIPAVAQPLHMLLGTMVLGMQFFILILLYYSRDVKSKII
ncbi:MAG: COX15/CtaA family protein [Cytophagaceae bacterium]|nr:COX15/CtaA family protein [Cytophagaceae bacterium]